MKLVKLVPIHCSQHLDPKTKAAIGICLKRNIDVWIFNPNLETTTCVCIGTVSFNPWAMQHCGTDLLVPPSLWSHADNCHLTWHLDLVLLYEIGIGIDFGWVSAPACYGNINLTCWVIPTVNHWSIKSFAVNCLIEPRMANHCSIAQVVFAIET